jgi:hypothetical protein
MFRPLILDSLARGAMSTAELYEIAKQKQPRDCTETPCPIGTRLAGQTRNGYTNFAASNTSFSVIGEFD